MNRQLENVKGWFLDGKFMQYIYLVFFTGLLMLYYLQTTVLEYDVLYRFYAFFHWGLAVYVIANTVLSIVKKTHDSYLEYVFMVLVLVVGIVVTQVTYNPAIFDFALLLIGAKNVEWKKIAYVYLCVALTLQCLAFYASTHGIVADKIALRNDVARHAYGIIYPTDMTAHWLFIMLVYIALREAKLTFVEITGMGLLTYWLYGQSDARNNFICGIILCVLLLVVKVLKIFHVQLSKYKIIKIGGFLMFAVVLLSLLAVTFYDPANATYTKLNDVFSNRIALSYQGLAQYGIPPFGTYVEENEAVLGYAFFLDNSFIRMAIKCGWIFLAIVTYVYVLLFAKAADHRKDYMLVALIVMVCAGIMEQHLIEIAYCPLWFMLFSQYGNVRNGEQRRMA